MAFSLIVSVSFKAVLCLWVYMLNYAGSFLSFFHHPSSVHSLSAH